MYSSSIFEVFGSDVKIYSGFHQLICFVFLWTKAMNHFLENEYLLLKRIHT